MVVYILIRYPHVKVPHCIAEHLKQLPPRADYRQMPSSALCDNAILTPITTPLRSSDLLVHDHDRTEVSLTPANENRSPIELSANDDSSSLGSLVEPCLCPCAAKGRKIKKFVTASWNLNWTLNSEDFPELFCPCCVEQFIRRPQVQPILLEAAIPVDSGREQREYLNWILWRALRHQSSPMSAKLSDPLTSYLSTDECYRSSRACCSQNTLPEVMRTLQISINVSARKLRCHSELLQSVIRRASRRPDWDTYFMRVAYLVSTRSNCIKRCVGSIVVADRRIVSTGYNGTPFSVPNCTDGGCARCADHRITSGQNLDDCTCIHAEVNALMEAGRAKCLGSTLYVTLFPCLNCVKFVVQNGIARIVYGETYAKKNTLLSSRLFDQVGVKYIQAPFDDGIPPY